MTADQKKIFCVADFYAPGFKGGGLIKSLQNLLDFLGNDFNFLVYTRDRDLGDNEAYRSVRQNQWNDRIYYAAPGRFGLLSFAKEFLSSKSQVVYLNSFFSFKGAILPLLAVKMMRPFRKAAIIIAPRGEFSAGALGIKHQKKALYLNLARRLGLYKTVTWQASTSDEAGDIARVFPELKGNILIASDLVSAGPTPLASPPPGLGLPGALKLVFLSRLSPKKNLAFLLDSLKQVSADVFLGIYGPIEDQGYWDLCKNKIRTMPPNIQVEYFGPVSPEKTGGILANFDLFAFPTLGENFGHVIFESLSAHTCVLVSDQTPWRTDTSGVITELSLADSAVWARKIDLFAALPTKEREQIRGACANYIQGYCDGRNKEALQENRKLFEHAVSLHAATSGFSS